VGEAVFDDDAVAQQAPSFAFLLAVLPFFPLCGTANSKTRS
jgi:hypothetical protein